MARNKPQSSATFPIGVVRRRQTTLGGAALGVLLLGIVLFMRPVPVQPFVARAEAAIKTNIYKEQSTGSTVIATLEPNQRVNVLKAPTMRSQNWVPVQFMDGNTALRPGFAHTGDLHNWDSSNPETALNLLDMFLLGDPGERGTQAGIDALQKLASRFPETAAARKAQLQTASLEIQAAERSKALGEPTETWQGRLDAARNHISAASRDWSLQEQGATVLARIEQLSGTQNRPDRPSNPAGQQFTGESPVRHTSPAPRTLTLERYPTIEAPAQVTRDQTFNVLVSLTKDLITPEVRASQPGAGSRIAADGRLTVSMPEAPSYTIDVVLMSRHFEVIGSDSAQIQLDKDSDSTPARFQLKGRGDIQLPQASEVQATFWHQGRYLARASRAIAIGDSLAKTAAAAPARAATRPMVASLITDEPAPDMTIFHLETGTGTLTSCQIIISTRYAPPVEAPCASSRDLSPWLDEQYRKILATSAEARGLLVSSQDSAERVQARAILDGFGRELYKRFAPDLFKSRFWGIRRLHRDAFHTIQIFTDNPLLPWELMIPVSPDGDVLEGFLGTEFQIARWHIETAPSTREVPPNRLRLDKVTVIAPHYQGSSFLPHQTQEVEALRRLPGSEITGGQFSTVAGVVSHPPRGIIHFIGHGMTEASAQGVASYAIRLEDRNLDLMTWRGLAATASESHPLYFLNACLVGQSNRVAHFVDGWAPAVLESGASGFIGAIWPVSDVAAADLASRFYGSMADRLQTGSAVVPELLRVVRRRFFETQDVTYLSYVFYGDVRLRVEKRPSE